MSNSSNNDSDIDGVNLDGLSMNDDPISVFLYGSSPGNGRDGATAAYACVFPDTPERNAAHAIDDGQQATNSRAILHAAIEALRIVNGMDPTVTHALDVYSNSEYLADTMTSHIDKWVRKGWRRSKGRRVENRDLLEQILDLRGKNVVRTITWKHFQKDVDERNKEWARDFHRDAERDAQNAAPPFSPM